MHMNKNPIFQESCPNFYYSWLPFLIGNFFFFSIGNQIPFCLVAFKTLLPFLSNTPKCNFRAWASVISAGASSGALGHFPESCTNRLSRPVHLLPPMPLTSHEDFSIGTEVSAGTLGDGLLNLMWSEPLSSEIWKLVIVFFPVIVV